MFHFIVSGGIVLAMTNSPRSQMNYRPRIGQASADGLLIVCKCYVCRRSRAYLATDLVKVYHPEIFIDDIFGGKCPRCGSGHNWRVKQRFPSDADVGMLTVRRLTGVRTTPLWRDELYSAPEKPKAG